MSKPFCKCGHAAEAHLVADPKNGLTFADCVCSGVYSGTEGRMLCEGETGTCGRYRPDGNRLATNGIPG